MENTNTSADQQPSAAPADEPLGLTIDQATDSLAALLDNSDPEPAKVADPVPAKEAKDEPEAPEEADPLGPDDDGEDVGADEANPVEDGSKDAGQYVSGKAKYKLADGNEITVDELVRNNMFQRDYSKKTEEVAREREAITKEKAEVDQLTRTASEERQFLMWFAEQFVPPQPQRPTLSVDQDPMGHMKYRDEVDRYNAFVNAYQQFKSQQDAEVQRKEGETKGQAAKRAETEVSALFTRLKMDPQKDGPKVASFFEALEKGAQEFYGLDATAIATLAKQDHRAVLVLRDAIRSRQSRNSAPQVQAQLKAVPRMVRTPTARNAPNSRQEQTRTVTREKLQRSGNFNDGVAAIEALLSQ